MTALLEPEVERPPPAAPIAAAVSGPPPPPPSTPKASILASQYRVLLAVWVVAVVVGTGLVIYGLGPLFQARGQRQLLRVEKRSISNAANEASGLGGVTTPTQAPRFGAPVGILEIGHLRLQQVVVEGAKSAQTRSGPAHVAGTAGLGQPGNSVVVGRAHAFGAPFNGLERVGKGDRILVTTTQGQSVYRVTSVQHQSLKPPTTTGATIATAAGGSATASGDVYGPSRGSRLTLLTSASTLPWNGSEAIVVVATLEGLPFPPTLQNGRGSPGLGLDGDNDADAAVIISMLAFGATLSGSILLYRQVRPTTAYLLTIGPVMATAIMAGETLSRVFPGWM